MNPTSRPSLSFSCQAVVGRDLDAENVLHRPPPPHLAVEGDLDQVLLVGRGGHLGAQQAAVERLGVLEQPYRTETDPEWRNPTRTLPVEFRAAFR
jgi:hypothetical protein